MAAGGNSEISGRPLLEPRRGVWIGYASFLIAVASISATSAWIKDGAATQTLWPQLVDELTSVFVVFVLTPGVALVTALLRPRRIGWCRSVAGHLAALTGFAAIHMVGMFLLRRATYPLFGGWYQGDESVLQTVIYEGRKDILVYVCLTIAIHQFFKSRTNAGPYPGPRSLPPPAPTPGADKAAPKRIPYREGSLRGWVTADDVLWVEAAGNYIEIVLASRRILLRQPLRAVESQLSGAGFVRVHRSRIVNSNHIRSLVTRSNGDFTLTLSNDLVISGSRRFRNALAAELGGSA
jgi:hypothetical protein